MDHLHTKYGQITPEEFELITCFRMLPEETQAAIAALVAVHIRYDQQEAPARSTTPILRIV